MIYKCIYIYIFHILRYNLLITCMYVCMCILFLWGGGGEEYDK